jgi:HSP20 family protein
MEQDPTQSLDVLRAHGGLGPASGPAGPEALLGRPGLWRPAADVAEGRDAWVIEVELPGLRRTEIVLELRPGELWVYGEGRSDGDGPAGRGLVRERRRGPFARRFALPPEVDGLRVFAAFGNGLLTVTLPCRGTRLSGRIQVPIE